MKRILFLIAAVAFGSIAVAQNRTVATNVADDAILSKVAAKADLKLMSFNIRYYKPGADGDNCWENRRDAVLKVVRDENPDIVGFQEPHRPQVDFLKINLSDYGSLDMGRDADTDIKKRPDGGEHLMLMYRKSRFILLDSGFFWLSELPTGLRAVGTPCAVA